MLYICFAEYIVSFNGYYKKETRGRYLQAALNGSNIHVTSWTIVDRHNPAFDYPSDFDVLKVYTYFFGVIYAYWL